MGKKELLWELAAKAVKTLVALFTLFAIGYFVERLPYASALPFVSSKLPVGVFLNAVVSALAVAVFVRFGIEISPAADGLLDFMPGAGKFLRSVVKILSLLFAYYAFQEPVFPFISDYEWAYQAAFLGFTLFYLVRAGLHVYGASDNISRALVGVLRQPQADPPPPPGAAGK